jgi:hypothetical protein
MYVFACWPSVVLGLLLLLKIEIEVISKKIEVACYADSYVN